MLAVLGDFRQYADLKSLGRTTIVAVAHLHEKLHLTKARFSIYDRNMVTEIAARSTKVYMIESW